MLKINDTSQQKNIMQQRFQIQQHDHQLHENKPLENDGRIKPFVKGLFIHVGIIGVIVLGNLTSDMGNSQPMVETSLITANELAGVQSQIAQSRKQGKKSGKIAKSHAQPSAKPMIARANPAIQQTSPQQNVPTEPQSGIKKFAQSVTEIFVGKSSQSEPPVTIIEEQVTTKTEKKENKAEISEKKLKPSKELLQQKEKLKEREVEFQKALEQFTKEEEEKARKARGEPEERRLMDEKELIEAFKKSEQKVENIVQEEKQTQEEIEKQRLEDLAIQELNKQILTEKQGEEGDSEGFEPMKKMSMGVPSSGGGRRKGMSDASNLIASKVYRHLHPPTNSGNDETKVRITVNARGEVLRVFPTGRNPDLNRAVVQAVNAASPLPITPNDKNYPIFTMVFEGHGNK